MSANKRSIGRLTLKRASEYLAAFFKLIAMLLANPMRRFDPMSLLMMSAVGK